MKPLTQHSLLLSPSEMPGVDLHSTTWCSFQLSASVVSLTADLTHETGRCFHQETTFRFTPRPCDTILGAWYKLNSREGSEHGKK